MFNIYIYIYNIIYIYIYIYNLPCWQVFDCVEVFSGVGTLSKCLTLAGYKTASLDVRLWQPWMDKRKSKTKRLRKTCRGNPLDLLTPAGFACLGQCWVLFLIWHPQGTGKSPQIYFAHRPQHFPHVSGYYWLQSWIPKMELLWRLGWSAVHSLASPGGRPFGTIFCQRATGHPNLWPPATSLLPGS